MATGPHVFDMEGAPSRASVPQHATPRRAAARPSRRVATQPPPPLRPSSGLVVARAHAHARARTRGEDGGGNRWHRHRHREASSRSLYDVAVSCVAVSCVGPLVVASLSRRVAIIAGYFRRCTRFLGGRGGSERTPRVRPLDRPTDYLTDRRCARASLSWRDRRSPRGGCCGRVRQPRRPYPAHAHRHELVMRCACRRAAAAVVARGRRARTCAQTALSSCPFTDVESMIIIVT